MRWELGEDTEAGCFDESTKVAVASKQRNLMIYKCLCDQGVSQARLPLPSGDAGAEETSRFPETSSDLQQRQAGERIYNTNIQPGRAQ